MDGENKKYLIIGIVIIVVAILIAGAFILSNTGITSIDSNANGGNNNEAISNIDQDAHYSNDSNHYVYSISGTLSNLDINKNYSVKCIWYNNDGEAVLTDNYDITDLKENVDKFYAQATTSTLIENITNCTIELFDVNGNLITSTNYNYVDTPVRDAPVGDASVRDGD